MVRKLSRPPTPDEEQGAADGTAVQTAVVSLSQSVSVGNANAVTGARGVTLSASGNLNVNAAEAEYLQRESTARAERDRHETGGENTNRLPTPAELNAFGRKRWDGVERLFVERIMVAPSALKAAVDQSNQMARDGVPGKWIPSLEELVVGDEVRARRADGRKQSDRASRSRPSARSPFTDFILDRPQATPADIEAALIEDADKGRSGLFEFSADKLAIVTTGKRKRRLKISGIPAAVAKARGNIVHKK